MNNNYYDNSTYDENYSNIKIEYHDPTDTGRVVSQTFSHQQSQGKPLSKARKILTHVETSGNNFPRIAIKREISGELEGEVINDKKSIFYLKRGKGLEVSSNKKNYLQVILLNGNWNSYSHNNYVQPEMHNVQTQDFSLQNAIFKNVGEASSTANDTVSSDSGIESDCTDGNLSWLLNYKIRELPPFPDSGALDNVDNGSKVVNTVPQPPVNEVIISEGYKAMHQATNNLIRKPPFTYTELIEHALSEKGELTVSGIYNWISNHFPFYKANDDRWKNSVRHNLSINPHFRKGGKAVQGAGHLWTIAQRDEAKSWQMRQRINDFLRVANAAKVVKETDNFDKELQAATESILEEIQSQNQIEPEPPVITNNTHVDDDIHVEFINMPEGVTGLEGFLAPPVPKQQIVNECGLGNDFFITDIDPNHLGLNLAGVDASDDKMYEEITLEYYGMKE